MILKQENLLNEGYLNHICLHQSPVLLAEGLRTLNLALIDKDVNILTRQDLINVLIKHVLPVDMAEALELLDYDLLDRQDLINALNIHEKPRFLAKCLSILRRWDFERGRSYLRTWRSFDIHTDLLQKLINHQNPEVLAEALTNLTEHPRNRLILEKLVDHQEPLAFSESMRYLSEVNISEKLFEVLAKHPKPKALAYAIYPRGQAVDDKLDRRRLSNYVPYHVDENIEHFDYLAAHSDPEELASLIQSLKRLNLAIEENISRASQYSGSELAAIENILNCFPRALRTQANLSILLNAEYQILLTKDVVENVWEAIHQLAPGTLPNQQIFNELVAITRRGRYAPMILNAFYYYVIREYATRAWQLFPASVHRLVNVFFPQREANAAPLNPAQSTHTASVHQSVSQTALRLKAQYGAGLDLEAVIRRMKEDVNALPASLKNDAAKRCIERITSPTYSHSESSTGISTLALLALAYQAIHDETKREGTLINAKGLLVEGLYESQRGYNLNEAGEDNGLADSPICTAGTFNKIIEKLVGIHPDVSVSFISKEVANLKFQRLAKQHAIEYIKAHQGHVEREALTESIEPIWPEIKDGVAALLWEEFSSLYPHRAQFDEMIETGMDLSLTEEELDEVFQDRVSPVMP